MCSKKEPGYTIYPNKTNGTNPEEFAPFRCSEALTTFLDTPPEGTHKTLRGVVRAVRGLALWLLRVYECIDERMTELEKNMPSEDRVTALEKRAQRLEQWKNGEGAGSSSFSKALQELVVSEKSHRLKLQERLHAHARGDITTPFGTFEGPGELLHEEHQHIGHIKITTEQMKRATKSREAMAEVIEEIERERMVSPVTFGRLWTRVKQLEARMSAIDDPLGPSPAAQHIPLTPEEEALAAIRGPVHCHQCGAKL